jgi:hypothetical protein
MTQHSHTDPASFAGARQCEHADVPLEMTLEHYRRGVAAAVPVRRTRRRHRLAGAMRLLRNVR